MFFIHIPKTAGTSFRKACEESIGRTSIAYDYGLKVEDTSSVVKKAYSEGVYKHIEILRRYALIAGHMPACKYAPVFGLANTFTFVRNPVQRCFSDFLHLKEHYGFKGGLESYLSRAEHRNRQSFFLSGIPLESIGFIGLTERYEQSLALLAARYPSLNVKPLKLNVNSSRPRGGYEIDKSDIELLVEANSLDIDLYKRAVKQFESQVSLYSATGMVLRGLVQHRTKHAIHGWLAGSKLCDVEAVLGDEVLATAEPKDFRSGLAGWGIEREGYVGFTLYNKDVDISECAVRVRSTDFVLQDQA